jgi:hypothetical protein
MLVPHHRASVDRVPWPPYRPTPDQLSGTSLSELLLC